GTLTFVTGTSTVYGAVNAATLNVAAGIVNFSAAVTATDGTFSGGGVGGSDTITYNGTLNWTGGVLEGTGKIVIGNTGTLNLQGIGQNLTLATVLENDGTANWIGVGSPFENNLYMDNGTFQNNGSFTYNTDYNLNANDGFGTPNNSQPQINVFNNA